MQPFLQGFFNVIYFNNLVYDVKIWMWFSWWKAISLAYFCFVKSFSFPTRKVFFSKIANDDQDILFTCPKTEIFLFRYITHYKSPNKNLVQN